MQGHCSTKEEGKPRQCPTPIMYQPYHPNPLQYWQHHTHTHTHLYASVLTAKALVCVHKSNLNGSELTAHTLI